MKDELFKKLLESVKQGVTIMKGDLQPSRMFEFPEAEVRRPAFHDGKGAGNIR
jgi:hypothetical protein